MVFRSGSNDFGLTGEGEDIVADDVGFTVVLVVAAAFSSKYDVVFDDFVRASLVGVDAPAAVAKAIDIVDPVADDASPGLDSEGVDTAHVAENALADVVNVVVGDDVVVGLTLGVAPGPADGDAGVVEVGDFVVTDFVIR